MVEYRQKQIDSVIDSWQEFNEDKLPEGVSPPRPSLMDSGYFYCPYVPIYKTPVVIDPDEFMPKKGIMTRYGKKLLEEGEKFYSRKKISDFE